MNKFEQALLQKAYQDYMQTGSTKTTYQMKNSDDWLYNSEALKWLNSQGYITIDENFDPDEKNLFAIIRPISYAITAKGISYVKEHLKP